MIERPGNDNPIYVNKGTSQENRMPQYLLPESIKIDDRDKTELIDFAGKYAELLRYYNIDSSNHLSEQGDWRFFTNDIIFFLADIARTDFKVYNGKYALALGVLGDSNETIYNKTLALRLLYGIAQDHLALVNKWYLQSARYTDDFVLHLQNSIKKTFSEQLTGLVKYDHLLMTLHKISDYPFLDPQNISELDDSVWINVDQPPSLTALMQQLNLSETSTPLDMVREVYPLVAESIQRFQNGLLYLISLAERRLNDNLSKRDDIKPDLGLLLGFMDLFKNAQVRLNGLTERHLNHYYLNTLKMEPAPLSPDSVYVYFEPAPSETDIVLNSGLDFDGGKDAEGNQVVFTLPETVFINQIKAVDFRSIYIGRNSDIETGFSPQLITGIYAVQHNVPGISANFPWPPFGEDQVMVSKNTPTMSDARVGFAIASPVFFLNSGNRTVEINLSFEHNSFSGLISQLNTVANKKEIPTDDAFYKVFLPALKVNATQLAGWAPVTIVSMRLLQKTDTLQLSIEIPETAPAITAYNSKVHGDGYNTDYPVFEITVEPVLPYYAYGFLESLVLSKVVINVEVSRMRNLSLYNQYGPIDVQNPFQPFGVQPGKGSYLLAGSNELFIKNTSNINVSLEWMSLPQQGLKKYYEGYGLPYDNQVFKTNTMVLHNGQWQPAGENISLFADPADAAATGETVPMAVSTIDISPFKKEYVGNVEPDSVTKLPVYDQFAYTGFVRIELTDPPYGFGADLYSNVLSQTVLKNATEKPKPPIPLPNPPFTPLALGVSMQYSASDQIDFLSLDQAADAGNKFYHLDVFAKYPALHRKFDTKGADVEKVNNKYGNGKYLLPPHTCNGEFIIGLVDVQAPQSVTLLFQLTQKEVDTDDDLQSPGIQWSYLSNNLWVPFKRGENIHDDTGGLVRSGIITFDLPVSITANNTIMPSGKYWIKASANKGHVEVLGNVGNVLAQAAQVIYNTVKSQPAVRDSLVLPPNTITKTLQEVPGVKSIQQPFVSYGGKDAETINHFYSRVSERLRHKKRAIALYDYERMVLENFPNVYRAKCVTSNIARGMDIKPGNIELMVIPYINAEGTLLTNEYSPVFGFTVLEEIKAFLQRHASPFAQIRVRNPLYEKLKVHCSVAFNVNNPFYIHQLNQDLMNFLSPWISSNKNVSGTGPHIQKSSIQGFIQHLDYVQMLTGFSITKTAYKKGRYYFYDTAAKENIDADQLYALTPWSVFVSASQHEIRTIGLGDNYQEPSTTGVSDVAIGTDFIVADDPMNAKAMLTLGASQASTSIPKQILYNI